MSPGLRVALSTLLLLVGIDGACYLLRAPRLPAMPSGGKDPFSPVVRVSSATMRRLGWLETGSASSFARFPREKRTGVVRVGCLGDSFTAGAEAGPGEDFPSLLQGLFRVRGFPQVEVLNFGSGGYGFQQAYTLWDEVSRHYGLDCVLLGPRTLFPDRDTFDHSSSGKTRTPGLALLNARRILDGPGLRLVEAAGQNPDQRSAAYRGWVPRWRYLRYDRRAPAFLACLLPRGRELRNPFYYRSDIRAEAMTIYERMLLTMADSGVRVVLGHYDPAVVQELRRVQRGNLCVTRLREIRQPPYRAVKNHDAPAGNRLLAEQFFAILTGARRADLPQIQFVPRPRTASPSREFPFRDLCRYARVSAGPEGGRSWRFVEVLRGTGVRVVPAEHFRRQGLPSLLALRLSQRPLPLSVFYPVGVPLADGMPLIVTPDGGAQAGREFVLGRVALLRPDLNIGVVDLGDIFEPAYPGFVNEDAVFVARDAARGLFPGEVSLGGQRLLRALPPDGAGRVSLQPRLRRFLQLYAPAEPLGGGADRAGGSLDVVLDPGTGAALRVPVGGWRRSREAAAVVFDIPEGFVPIRRPPFAGR